MKKHLTWIGLLMVLAFSLALFSGCAEKKAVVKDEAATQEQKVAAAQDAAPAVAQQAARDDEAAKKAKEQAANDEAAREAAAREAAAREAWLKKNAEALTDLNMQNIYFDYDKSSIRPDAREILKANAEIFNKNGNAAIVP
jgi:outer membrane protein OmpA-like peptidoglycan-associated protein